VYFQAEVACPVFPELAQILFKTVGVVEALRKTLEPLHNQIDIALIYGSIAASAERSMSDIDLMVIGSAKLSRIAPLLRDLERQVGRLINPTVYGRDEFTKRVQGENHFLRVQGENHFLKSVLRGEPLFIKGGPDELAKLTAGAKNKIPPHQPTGTRRPARRN
jgi:predicted nucleotidyltransferase